MLKFIVSFKFLNYLPCHTTAHSALSFPLNLIWLSSHEQHNYLGWRLKQYLEIYHSALFCAIWHDKNSAVPSAYFLSASLPSSTWHHYIWFLYCPHVRFSSNLSHLLSLSHLHKLWCDTTRSDVILWHPFKYDNYVELPTTHIMVTCTIIAIIMFVVFYFILFYI